MTTTSSERTSLYYKAGSSDKEYHASIEPKEGGFVVSFAYGRRGSTLQTGTKTPQPVEYAAARKIYDKLIAEKLAKGYTPGEAGTPYQDTSREERATGILPQLLNAIDEAEAQRLIEDADWLAQEKLDGKRVLILRKDEQVLGINRQGLVIALPGPIVEQARGIGSQQWLIDGEAVGEVYWAFDLLESACVNLRGQPYQQRIKALADLLPADRAGAIRTVETANGSAAKRALRARLQEAKKEGIVFKRADAPHTPGRPASGGDQRKLKFCATASCIVAGVNGKKRSVALELVDKGCRVGVGSVTIPPNHQVPAKGDVVEARYLYAYAGGGLYQPVYLGKRDDVAALACVVGQLKHKPAAEEES